MGNLSVFKAAVIALFVVAAIGGLVFLSLFRGGSGAAEVGAVEVWGLVDEQIMTEVFDRLGQTTESYDDVTYRQLDVATYETELVNALASGRGPDLFILPHEALLAQQDRIIPIPYENYSERQFQDTFAQVGEVFLFPEGVKGFPFSVDPLVMYWNRDILQTAGLAKPPKLWSELLEYAPQITRRDAANNITRSFVALGETQNIAHAKPILSSMLMQQGNPIVARNQNGQLTSLLGDRLGLSTPPAQAVLRYYTEFSNPIKATYTWNRSLPEARQEFIAGDVALYFGFASELSEIRRQNPNLNFDVAPLPQANADGTKVAYGRTSGLVIMRGSDNASGAYLTALALSGGEAQSILRDLSVLPPVRRDLLASRPSDAFRSIFYDSALMARAWLDPDPQQTTSIFSEMVNTVTSGRARESEAVNTADARLRNLLPE